MFIFLSFISFQFSFFPAHSLMVFACIKMKEKKFTKKAEMSQMLFQSLILIFFFICVFVFAPRKIHLNICSAITYENFYQFNSDFSI